MHARVFLKKKIMQISASAQSSSFCHCSKIHDIFSHCLLCQYQWKELALMTVLCRICPVLPCLLDSVYDWGCVFCSLPVEIRGFQSLFSLLFFFSCFSVPYRHPICRITDCTNALIFSFQGIVFCQLRVTWARSLSCSDAGMILFQSKIVHFGVDFWLPSISLSHWSFRESVRCELWESCDMVS